MTRDWKQNDDGGRYGNDNQERGNWQYRNNNRGGNSNSNGSSSSSWDRNNNRNGGGYKNWKKDDDWSKKTWGDNKRDDDDNHSGGWKSSSNEEHTNEKEHKSNDWKSSDNGDKKEWKDESKDSWGDKKEWKDNNKWDNTNKWESNKDNEGSGWNSNNNDWEDNKDNDKSGEVEDKWKSNDYEGGNDEQPESEEYGDDDDDDAVADMEYSDDWSSSLVWVRTASVGQLEFTVGDTPQFDSSIDTSSLWNFKVYLNRVPGSRPLTIPVVTGDMEKLVFVPRIESKDDEDIWNKVVAIVDDDSSDSIRHDNMVKMCMGKDSNGIIALDYTKEGDDDYTYQNGGPTSLTSPKEFWTEVDEIPTRSLCITHGDRVLYFDSWAQLDTPYISATYATRQDRTSILAGHHKEDRSWEGFTVGVKLINPDRRTNNSLNWEPKKEGGEEGEEQQQQQSEEEKANWFNITLNGGKLNVWVPNKPVKDTDEKVLIFKHTRKESMWIIPEAWLRTGISDKDVDEALSSPNRAIKSMNGYAYYQQFYGTVNTLYKSSSDEGGSAAAVVAVPEIKDKPSIQEQIMIMSKSFWLERDGREGRLQQLREKCQVMKDYNDNLTSQLDEAQGLYQDLLNKVQQMKEKLGVQDAAAA